MKKLNVLLILAVLVSALTAQAVVPAKLVRLEVYNWTGEPVMMRLEGVITGQFYYLTNPPTSRGTGFSPKVWTVLTDRYRLTTWACGGVESGRELRMLGNNRLVFTACGTLPLRTINQDVMPLRTFGDGRPDKAPNWGEPTQEKVVFFSAYTSRVWIKAGDFGWPPFRFDPTLPTPTNIWVKSSISGGAGFFLFGVPFGGWGVPLVLQDFCSPNNCFYRITWDGIAGNVGIAVGPGAGASRGFGTTRIFRYRY